MNVTVAYDFGEAYVQRLRGSFPQARITAAYSAAEQFALAPEVEVQFGLIDRPTFLAARRLKWFHFVGIGFDSILRAIPEFIAGGVLMTNARGTHVVPMAEYAIGMMIALAHWLRESFDDQRARRWETAKYRGHILELAGSTLGILACGDLGRARWRRARRRWACACWRSTWSHGRRPEWIRYGDWSASTRCSPSATGW